MEKSLIPIGSKTRFGTVQSVSLINGERYYYMINDKGTVSMMPAMIVENTPIKIILPPVASKAESILYQLDKITDDAKKRLEKKLRDIIKHDHPKNNDDPARS